MFTGIVETTGKVICLRRRKSNLLIGIESSIAKELKTGQSVSHDGVCLTITSPPSPLLKERGVRGEANIYFVTAVKETLNKTNFRLLRKGSRLNLERSLKVGNRLDGHFVQGHVDCTARVNSIKREKGSWLFKFKIQNSKFKIQNLLIEKGSICINGVSLTAFDVQTPTSNILNFAVAIIPHTYNITNFSSLKTGSMVNIEFDVLGKYMEKICSSQIQKNARTCAFPV